MRPFFQLSTVKPFVSNEMDFFSSISVLCQEFQITGDKTILGKHLLSIVLILEMFQETEEKSSATRRNSITSRQTSGGSGSQGGSGSGGSGSGGSSSGARSVSGHKYGTRAGTEVLAVVEEGGERMYYVGVQSSGLLERALHLTHPNEQPILIHAIHNSNFATTASSTKRLYIQSLHLHPLSFRFLFGGAAIEDGTAAVSTPVGGGGGGGAGGGGGGSGLRSESSELQQRQRRRRRKKGIGEEESNVLSKWKQSSSFMSSMFTMVDIDTDLRVRSFQHNDVFTQWQVLVTMIGQHYVSELTSSFVSLLHLIGGSVSRGVASLAMDQEYLQSRQTARRTERISHVVR